MWSQLFRIKLNSLEIPLEQCGNSRAVSAEGQVSEKQNEVIKEVS